MKNKLELTFPDEETLDDFLYWLAGWGDDQYNELAHEVGLRPISFYGPEASQRVTWRTVEETSNGE